MGGFEKADALLAELLQEPERFDGEGKAYSLLQFYFHGFPLQTLVPLLGHNNVHVRRSAAFVVSEIGKAALPLVDHMAKLTIDSDRHIQWYALESVMVCSAEESPENFVHVAIKLECDDLSICQLAMRLISRSTTAQLKAALHQAGKGNFLSNSHAVGLALLLRLSEVADRVLLDHLESPDKLIQRYGAIAALQRSAASPVLLAAARRSGDPAVAEFARDSH